MTAGDCASVADSANNKNSFFLINHFGIPLDDKTWDDLWDYIKSKHDEGEEIESRIRGNDDLPQVPVHNPPFFHPTTTITRRLELIQRYFGQLQYNHTGMQFFDIKKNRSLVGLMDVARNIIKESLPIKCLEASVLGIYLTNGFSGLTRFAVSFKSVSNGTVYRHIVLGLYHSGVYGAIGLSRNKELMYRPLKFETLSQLVLDFVSTYNSYLHHVTKVKVGLPIPHDQHSCESISWRYLVLNLAKLSNTVVADTLDKHGKLLRKYHIYRYSSNHPI